MARLPDTEIARLKSENSLVRLVEAQGHTVVARKITIIQFPELTVISFPC